MLLWSCFLFAGCGVQDIDLSPPDSDVLLLDGLPSNTPRRFESAAADDERDPMLAFNYPDDGAALPLDLPPLTMGWSDGKKMAAKEPMPARIFELAIATSSGVLRIYTTQSSAMVPEQHWRRLLAAGPGQDLTLRLRAVEADNKVRSGKPLMLPLRASLPAGRLYFWSEPERALKRLALARGEVELVASQRDVACAACWALSSDGTQLLQINDSGALRVRSLVDGTLRAMNGAVDPQALQSAALDGSGQYAVVVSAAGSSWHQTLDAPRAAPQLPALTSFAFVAQGERVVYVRSEQAPMMPPMMMMAPMAVGARLEQARLSPAGELSEGLLLTQAEKADEGIAHVACSGTGSLIAFERTRGPDGKESALALWSTLDGKLTQLDKGSKRDGWPAFVPASADDEEWLVFASGRDGPSAKLAPGQAQLWLWNVQRLDDGSVQPASAPLWLPVQTKDDVLTRPQWGL